MKNWFLHLVLIGAHLAVLACDRCAGENCFADPSACYESASAGDEPCFHSIRGDAMEDPNAECAQPPEEFAPLPRSEGEPATVDRVGAEEATSGRLTSFDRPAIAALDDNAEAAASAVADSPQAIRVTTLSEQSRISLFGGISAEMICATARPIIPSAVLQIFPDSGRDVPIAQVHAKSSYLGAAIAGPSLGDLQSGGTK